MKTSLFAILGIAFSLNSAHAAGVCLFGEDTSKLYDAPAAATLGLTYEQTVTIDKADGTASVSDGPNKGKAYLLSHLLLEQVRRTIARNYGRSTTLLDALSEMSGSSYAGALRFYSAPSTTRVGTNDNFVFINFYPGDNEYGIIFQIKNQSRTVRSYTDVADVSDGSIEGCKVFR